MPVFIRAEAFTGMPEGTRFAIFDTANGVDMFVGQADAIPPYSGVRGDVVPVVEQPRCDFSIDHNHGKVIRPRLQLAEGSWKAVHFSPDEFVAIAQLVSTYAVTKGFEYKTTPRLYYPRALRGIWVGQ